MNYYFTGLLILALTILALFVEPAYPRNEYLNEYGVRCGELDFRVERRDTDYNYSPGSTHENQNFSITYRKYLGTACTDEFIAEQEKQMKIKTQLEVIKECKRVPRINPPPPEFAELINMCMKVGVMSSSHFVGDRDYDPKVSYWTVLKEQYMKENPDIITLDNYKK